MKVIFHLLITILLISIWAAMVLNLSGFLEFDQPMFGCQPKHKLQGTRAGSSGIMFLMFEKPRLEGFLKKHFNISELTA